MDQQGPSGPWSAAGWQQRRSLKSELQHFAWGHDVHQAGAPFDQDAGTACMDMDADGPGAAPPQSPPGLTRVGCTAAAVPMGATIADIVALSLADGPTPSLSVSSFGPERVGFWPRPSLRALDAAAAHEARGRKRTADGDEVEQPPPAAAGALCTPPSPGGRGPAAPAAGAAAANCPSTAVAPRWQRPLALAIPEVGSCSPGEGPKSRRKLPEVREAPAGAPPWARAGRADCMQHGRVQPRPRDARPPQLARRRCRALSAAESLTADARRAPASPLHCPAIRRPAAASSRSGPSPTPAPPRPRARPRRPRAAARAAASTTTPASPRPAPRAARRRRRRRRRARAPRRSASSSRAWRPARAATRPASMRCRRRPSCCSAAWAQAPRRRSARDGAPPRAPTPLTRRAAAPAARRNPGGPPAHARRSPPMTLCACMPSSPGPPRFYYSSRGQATPCPLPPRLRRHAPGGHNRRAEGGPLLRRRRARARRGRPRGEFVRRRQPPRAALSETRPHPQPCAQRARRDASARPRAPPRPPPRPGHCLPPARAPGATAPAPCGPAGAPARRRAEPAAPPCVVQYSTPLSPPRQRSQKNPARDAPRRAGAGGGRPRSPRRRPPPPGLPIFPLRIEGAAAGGPAP